MQRWGGNDVGKEGEKMRGREKKEREIYREKERTHITLTDSQLPESSSKTKRVRSYIKQK